VSARLRLVLAVVVAFWLTTVRLLATTHARP
jgi:hypothetical protein